MIATPSAPPSIGSVPLPTSSSSTSAGSASALSIDTMLVMCHEKVLRLAAIDCSSPMSAKTLRNTGSREPGLGRHEQAGLRHQRQQPRRLERDGLAAGVRARDDQRLRRRHDEQVAGHRLGVAGDAPSDSGSRRATAGISSGWRACRSSSRPSCDSAGRTPLNDIEQRALRLDHVELGGGLERRLQIAPRGRGSRR